MVVEGNRIDRKAVVRVRAVCKQCFLFRVPCLFYNVSFISRVVSVELDECKGWPISAVLPYSRPGRFAESGPEMMAFLGHGGTSVLG